MRVSFFLILLSTCLSAWSFAAPKTKEISELFFHWGDVEGNRALLELGGYKEASHTGHLSAGSEAILNEQVLEKTRQWYAQSNHSDAAGPGLYISSDPWSSKTYGDDLLIIEVTRNPHTSFQRNLDLPSIRFKANDAFMNQNYSQLPLATRFDPYFGWSVVSRDLTPAEKQKFKIVLRPPRTEDIPRIWEEKIIRGLGGDSQKRAVEQIARIAATLNHNRKTGQELSRSALIVYEKLLFDYAPDYLPDALPVRIFTVDATGQLPSSFTQFSEIFNAFRTKQPNDPWTHRLFQLGFQRLKANTQPIKSAHLLSFLVNNTEDLPKHVQHEIFEWMVKSFSPEVLKTECISYLSLAARVFDQLNAEQRVSVRRLLLETLDGSRINAESYLRTRNLLTSIFGKSRATTLADQMLANHTRGIAKKYSSGTTKHFNLRKDTYAAADDLRKEARHLAVLLKKNPELRKDRAIQNFIDTIFLTASRESLASVKTDIALTFFDQLDLPILQQKLRTSIIETTKKNRAQLNAALHSTYDQFKDPKVIAAIKKLAIEAYFPSQMIASAEPQFIYEGLLEAKEMRGRTIRTVRQIAERAPSARFAKNPFESYFEHILRDPLLTAQEFEKRSLVLIDEFPELSNEIAEALDELQDAQKSKLTISWNRISRAAKKKSRQFFTLDEIAENEYTALNKFYRTTKDMSPPAKEHFVNRFKKTIQNIPGSPEYSEISRTFNLIEPLFITEDIRRIAATRPFERFNETLTVDGKITTQPAWENFNEAWERLASDLWLIEKAPAKKSTYFFTKLLKTHQRLMSTQVDGASQEANITEWDRTKYRTFIPEKEWSDWRLNLKKSQLNRFFTVKKTAAGYDLQFRKRDELPTSFLRKNDKITRDVLPAALLSVIQQNSLKVRNPIQRATQILYLTTRLHPFENGNGRLARLWASSELVRAGYPMPMGFMTTEFVMTQEQIELEVRKSIKLGEFWEKMINDASQKGIRPEDFFQKVYRGSALEGISHISPRNVDDLAFYVDWLYQQKEPPQWGTELARKIEKKLFELHSSGGTVAQMDELKRARMLEEIWTEFHSSRLKEGVANLPPKFTTHPGYNRVQGRNCLRNAFSTLMTP